MLIIIIRSPVHFPQHYIADYCCRKVSGDENHNNNNTNNHRTFSAFFLALMKVKLTSYP